MNQHQYGQQYGQPHQHHAPPQVTHPRHQPHQIHHPQPHSSQPHQQSSQISATQHQQQQQGGQAQNNVPAQPPVTYSAERVVGSGSFGVVYQARVVDPLTGLPGETVAIKKVYLDPEYKNRELQILSELDHPSIVGLRHCFYAQSLSENKTYINLVMDFLPETIHKVVRDQSRARVPVSIDSIRCYIYQIIRGLSYIHHKGICHRDLKPQNILFDEASKTVRICDFGSAKRLSSTEQNVAYICSRYYRAPELALGARIYSTAVDVWSAGCVFAELMLGKPLFPGDSSNDQILRILTVLGYPKPEDYIGMGLSQPTCQQTIQTSMAHQNKQRAPKQYDTQPYGNQFYSEQQFLQPIGLREVLGSHIPNEAVDLLSQMLHYNPQRRITAFDALSHPFFNQVHCFTYQSLDPTQHSWEIANHNWTETECTLIGQLPLHKRSVLFPYWLRDRISRKHQQLANFEELETFNCVRYMLQLQHSGFACSQPQPMNPTPTHLMGSMSGSQPILANATTPQPSTATISAGGNQKGYYSMNPGYGSNGMNYNGNPPQQQQQQQQHYVNQNDQQYQTQDPSQSYNPNYNSHYQQGYQNNQQNPISTKSPRNQGYGSGYHDNNNNGLAVLNTSSSNNQQMDNTMGILSPQNDTVQQQHQNHQSQQQQQGSGSGSFDTPIAQVGHTSESQMNKHAPNMQQLHSLSNVQSTTSSDMGQNPHLADLEQKEGSM